MKKIILIGNGVSLRYKYDEYNYFALVEKLTQGSNVSISMQEVHSHIISSTSKKLNEIKELTPHYGEGTWFEMYKAMVINSMNNGYGSSTKITSYGFESGEDAFESIYNSIRDGKNIGSSLNWTIAFWFKTSYEAMSYGLCRSIAININNNQYIEIPYPKEFIGAIKQFDAVLTTNYYTDLERFGVDVQYIHNKIVKKENFVFIPDGFERKHTLGNEFDQHSNGGILFGRDYNDKVFLNSVLAWYSSRILKPVTLTTNYDFTGDADVTIIGMSVNGDKELVKNILLSSNSVLVFYHTKEDRSEWENLSNELGVEILLKKDNEFFTTF